MIDKTVIEKIVKEFKGESDLFLVDILVSPQNAIHVEIDRPEGISIDECVEMNRFINEKLDRELEDYELEVSSPGIGSALKVFPQYLKNIGRTVEIIKFDGSKLIGILLSATKESIKVEIEKKVRQEGKKRPEILSSALDIPLSDIKSTKVLISFK